MLPESSPFHKLLRAGYKNLVPIVPPGAQISEKSSLAKRPGAIGKAVGIRGADGTWRGLDWLRFQPTPADIEQWDASGAGVGIRTGDGIVALDIDSLDPAIAAQAEALAVATLGAAPVRYGRAPKRLMVYSTQEPIPYTRVEFTGADGKPERIELLSDGRQFVASGIHPGTRKPYAWDAASPLVPFASLTNVTHAQIATYFAELARTLPAAHKPETLTSTDRANVNQAALTGDLTLVSKAVSALPNRTELFPTYDDYIRVGAAIKGATQHDPDHGLELFLSWCEKWEGGNDLEVALADYGRIKPPYELGANWLYEKADRYSDGAFNSAEAWFEPIPTDDNPFAQLAAQQQASATQPEPVEIKWADFDEWENRTPAEREWEVEGWIPRGEVTLLYGDGGIGKTLLAHQYATAAAAGIDWLSQPTRQARVMCFFCEDSEDELHRRQVDINNSFGIGYAEIKENLRITSRKYMDNLFILWDRNSGAMRKQAVWEKLLTDALDFRADVLVIDTLADVYSGSEIDRSQVNAFVKSCLGRLAQETGGSVIALGHPSLSGKASGSGTSGSTAWSNAARSRLFLRYPKGVEKGNVRELEGMKLNYGPKGSLLKLEWKRGAFAVLAGSTLGGRMVGENARLIASLDDAAEAAVLAVLPGYKEMGLSLNQRATAFAPRILKQREPEALQPYGIEEVEAALLRLERKGVIKVAPVGKKANRTDLIGLIVVDTLSVGGGVFG